MPDISINTHSSIKISGSAVIYADPFEITDASNDADMVLITHPHFDHFSPDDIKKIMRADSFIVFPASMKSEIAGQGFENERCVPLSPGEKTDIGGVRITAVPAYNVNAPFHTRDRNWLGYIAELDGEKIFIAGDTDKTPENSAVVCDTALLPAGGKYTMDYKEAAALALALSPKKAVPTHYGSIAGTKDDGRKFAELIKNDITEVEILI